MKTVKLGEVCTFQRGLTYTKSDEVNFSNSPVLRATNVDVKTNRLIFDEIRYIKDDVNVPANKKIKRDSLLICTASGSKAHVGKVALVDVDYDYAFGGFMGQITPTKDVLSKYLFYMLTGPKFKDFLMSLNDGTNINNLKFSDIEDYETPLPSLPEQKAIVEKLDAAFAEIDVAESLIKSRAFQSNRLRLALCEQRITLLQPERYLPLRDLAKVITKGTTPTSIGFSFINSGVNFLKVESLSEDGTFVHDKVASISTVCHEALRRSQLQSGDVLVSIAGALGRTALVTKDICPANVNQALCLVRLGKESHVQGEFLLALFQSGYFNEVLDSLAAGVAQKNLSLAQIGGLEVPILTTEGQKSFISFVDDVVASFSDIGENGRTQLNLYQKLRQSILNSSFTMESNVA